MSETLRHYIVAQTGTASRISIHMRTGGEVLKEEDLPTE